MASGSGGAHVDDLTAVVAHSLLVPVAACETAARTVLEHEGRLPSSVRDELLELIVARATHTAEMLLDLVRGGRPSLTEALDALPKPYG